MNLKDGLGRLTRKAQDLAGKHPDQVKQAIDKAENLIDQRTGHKHSDQIHSAGAKAEDFLEQGSLKRDDARSELPPETLPPA